MTGGRSGARRSTLEPALHSTSAERQPHREQQQAHVTSIE